MRRLCAGASLRHSEQALGDPEGVCPPHSPWGPGGEEPGGTSQSVTQVHAGLQIQIGVLLMRWRAATADDHGVSGPTTQKSSSAQYQVVATQLHEIITCM
jgi:hypothetical protein